MSDVPCVSVIIPVFNRTALLLRAVDSVLAQTFSDFEIIVVDDCSATDIGAMLRAHYMDERLVYMRLGQNAGCGQARNAGVCRAQGKYIAFLDSDDIWMPTKLSTQMADIRRAGKEEVFSFSQIFYHDGITTKVLPDRGPWAKERIDEYLYCSSGPIHTSSVILSRSVALRQSFLPLRQGEDDELWIRIGAEGVAVVFTPEPLSWWYAEPDRQDRLCNNWIFDDGRHWITSHGHRLSARARRAYFARRIAPELHRAGKMSAHLLALFYVFRSLLAGDLSFRAGGHLLLRVLMPVRMYDALKRMKAVGFVNTRRTREVR